MNVEELTELEDMRALQELFLRVWERSSEPPLNSDVMRALSHAGNYLAGVRVEGRLVAGIVAWLGMHPDRELLLHSHILGVLPGSDSRGLGFALKQHQRTWCLARGIKTVEWTFDPLVRRNASFNLRKLGADAEEYLVDFYGPMQDRINAGVESDRILARWHLESAKAVAAAAGRPHEVERAAGDTVCEVPDDIVAIRRSDPEAAREWRRKVRATLGAHLMRGGRVKGFTPHGSYVLEQGSR
jgi:predicted GNAT superfamily acetyltransferase